MIITAINIKNYRNIREASLTFAHGMNVLYGDNGQGKTNLLEAVSLFALGRSFRGAKDRELINTDEPYGAEVELNVERAQGISTKLNIRYTPEGRRICRKNGVCVRSLAEFVGNFRVVLFASPQLSIVRDSAASRRHFLDSAISQLKPVYMERLTKMNRILLQRNKLLKQLAENPSYALRATLEPWTLQFAAESAFISAARFRYVQKLSGEAAAVVRDISGGSEQLGIVYPEPPDCKTLFERMMTLTDREIHAGTTLAGAHREDMFLTLGVRSALNSPDDTPSGRDARVFASQGQQRSIALALKLAEGILSEGITHDMPVYLLDDVLSELDDSRRRYVLENISGRQVILTMCDNNVSGDMIYNVSGGEFEKCTSI